MNAAVGGGGRCAESAGGPEPDRLKCGRLRTPPPPLAHLGQTLSLSVNSIALAEARGGGQRRGGVDTR